MQSFELENIDFSSYGNIYSSLFQSITNFFIFKLPSRFFYQINSITPEIDFKIHVSKLAYYQCNYFP